MDYKVGMYLLYLAVSIGLTIWVARTASRNGQVFLEDVFDDERLARAVNSLLVVGFYLLNLGYVTAAMRHADPVRSTSEAMEELSLKVGLVLLVLGALHFFNVFALGRYRRSRLRQLATHPPVAPVGMLPRPPVAQSPYPQPMQGRGPQPHAPHLPPQQPPGQHRPEPQPGANPPEER